MLKSFLPVLLIGSLFLIVITTPFTAVVSNSAGAPASHTGSPFDGRTCNTSGCHTGLSVLSSNELISSNIPSTGYLPGLTYTFTVKGEQQGINKFGFQVSPQSPSGALMGTMIATQPSFTQLVGGGKYLTHKTGGTSGSGMRTWEFDWTAPSDQDTIHFYAAVNAANGNGSSSGDQIYKGIYTITKDITTGIARKETGDGFKLYPNPVSGSFLTLSLDMKSSTPVSVEIYSIDGRSMGNDFKGIFAEGHQQMQLNVEHLPSGIYVVSMRNERGFSSCRFIRN